MLMRFPARSSRLLCIFSSLSLFTSQSSSNPNVRSPPRKGRQAVRRILNLLSSQSENPNLCETLKTLEISPETLSSSQASSLITAISNPLISFDFYRYLKSPKPIFKFDSILFSSLIRSQLQSINPKLFKIQYYFNEMEKHKVSLSIDDLCGFFDLVVPNCVEIAEFFISEALEKIEFDEVGYNYVISVYSKHGLFKEAILVAEKARARFEKPSLRFYSCLMDVFRVNGDARAAMKLFLEMEERGVPADEGIFTVLLGILGRVGSVKLCLVLLEEMKRVGYRLDECLGVDLMKMFIKEGMVSEAEYFFREGILKDRESFNVLVEAITEKGRPWAALDLMKNVCESDLNVDGSVYASVIHGCGKMGLIEDAEKIFSEVKSLEVVKNKELLYSSMIYVYSKAGMRRMAEMIFNEIESPIGFTSGGSEFLYMMSMYGALGLVDEVIRMFDYWKKISSGCTSVDGYVVLIDALSKSGKMNQAGDFLLEMRSFGIHPTNSIYSALIEGYLRVGLVNHAIALYNEYKMLGLEADDVIASSILWMLIQVGQYSELGVYLDKLMLQGIIISRDKGALLMEMCRDDSCCRKLGQLLEVGKHW